MAKILQETIVINVSKLVKNNDSSDEFLVDDEILVAIEDLVNEIITNPNTVVEVTRETNE